MIKKRKSYRVVAGSIRSELLRGLSRKICIGALAFSAAVVLLPGGKVGAYASDQTRVSSDESQVTVGYDDLDDTLQKGGLGVVVEQQDGAASLASTYDATALEKLIVEGIKAWQTSIDVSELGLTRDDINNGAVRPSKRPSRRRKVTFALGDKDAASSRGNLAGIAVELVGHQAPQCAGNVLARKRMVGARRQHDAVVALTANDSRGTGLHVIATRHKLNAHAGILEPCHKRIAKGIAPNSANHARARTHARSGNGLIGSLTAGVGDKTAATDGLARARHALARHRKVHVHAAEHRNDAVIRHGNLLVFRLCAHRRPTIVHSRTPYNFSPL